MSQEIFDAIYELHIPKRDIEIAVAMPKNSLSRYCSGQQRMPKKFIEPVQEYVELFRKYKADGRKLPKGLTPLKADRLKKAAAVVHDRQDVKEMVAGIESVKPSGWDPALVANMKKAADKAIYNNERGLREDNHFGLGEPEFSDKPLVMQGKKALNTFQDIANLPKKHPVEKAADVTPVVLDDHPEGKPEIPGAHSPEQNPGVHGDTPNSQTCFQSNSKQVPEIPKREYVRNLKTVEPLPGTNAFFLKYGKWS